MGNSADWRRLGRRMVRHHLPMAIVTTALLFAGVWAVASPDLKYRWSMSTAYVGLALLGAVALIGPANAVRQRTLPISSDFRRDLALWAALVSLGHLVVGWTMHMSSIWLYLFKAIDGPNAWRLRDDLFGWANYTGLAAGILLLAALVTSNDLSIRMLGRRGWKLLQQTTYLALALIGFHGIAYQWVEKRWMVYGVVLGSMLGMIVCGQVLGILARREAGRARGKQQPATSQAQE